MPVAFPKLSAWEARGFSILRVHLAVSGKCIREQILEKRLPRTPVGTIGAAGFPSLVRNREHDFGESLPNGPLAEARDDAYERSAPAARRGTIAIASTTDASSRLEARPP